MLLKNTNRKPYTIFRMVPLSMTYDFEWPLTRISRSRHFLKSNIVKTAPLKDKVTIAQEAQEETIPNIWNGTMFCLVTSTDHQSLNASPGFVSISWHSCYDIRSGNGAGLFFEVWRCTRRIRRGTGSIYRCSHLTTARRLVISLSRYV